MKEYGGVNVQIHSFFTSALAGGEAIVSVGSVLINSTTLIQQSSEGVELSVPMNILRLQYFCGSDIIYEHRSLHVH
jgi:hypothetical protein